MARKSAYLRQELTQRRRVLLGKRRGRSRQSEHQSKNARPLDFHFALPSHTQLKDSIDTGENGKSVTQKLWKCGGRKQQDASHSQDQAARQGACSGNVGEEASRDGHSTI